MVKLEPGFRVAGAFGPCALPNWLKLGLTVTSARPLRGTEENGNVSTVRVSTFWPAAVITVEKPINAKSQFTQVPAPFADRIVETTTIRALTNAPGVIRGQV